MNTEFTLDSRLENDCYELGELPHSLLLLMDNALVPWLILVPFTDQNEFTNLEIELQKNILEEVNLVSDYLQTNYSIDKLNIAAIGNVVSQLHIHIVGRRRDDYCWPAVVWGQPEKLAYDQAQVSSLVSRLEVALGDKFTTTFNLED
jgi:diadenosine tetraphosphate (Ap4A) HIT family hydrolase